jgi:hypothetical protein
VDAVAIQEPNTDFMKANIRDKYNEIFKEDFGLARVITATSCIDAPHTWNPGGVVLAILGPWSKHISKVSRDDLGRWASATLTGSDSESFTVCSVYNVVDVKLHDAGPLTVYLQQYRLLRLAGITYPKPWQQCVDDLNREIQKLVANGETIALLGDFNEELGQDPGLMAAVCANHRLFDAHAHLHG